MSKVENDIPHLHKLVKGIKFAMMVTRDQSGSFHSRPMTLQESEFDGDFWFFASRTRGPAPDVVRDANVNLSFAKPESSEYVSVSGHAELSQDRAKIEELWSPMYKTWFEKGIEDPDLTLIRVRVESADYWESPSSKVLQLVAFARAMVTGKSAAGDIGERGHLDIRNK
jgi:general stress protein 26